MKISDWVVYLVIFGLLMLLQGGKKKGKAAAKAVERAPTAPVVVSLHAANAASIGKIDPKKTTFTPKAVKAPLLPVFKSADTTEDPYHLPLPQSKQGRLKGPFQNGPSLAQWVALSDLFDRPKGFD